MSRAPVGAHPRYGLWSSGRVLLAGHTEPFPSCLCVTGLQNVDGLGELTGAPWAAAQLPENFPGFELCVRPLAGSAELRVSAVGLFLGFRLVLTRYGILAYVLPL